MATPCRLRRRPLRTHCRHRPAGPCLRQMCPRRDCLRWVRFRSSGPTGGGFLAHWLAGWSTMRRCCYCHCPPPPTVSTRAHWMHRRTHQTKLRPCQQIRASWDCPRQTSIWRVELATDATALPRHNRITYGNPYMPIDVCQRANRNVDRIHFKKPSQHSHKGERKIRTGVAVDVVCAKGCAT
jgi:hypothetical protein